MAAEEDRKTEVQQALSNMIYSHDLQAHAWAEKQTHSFFSPKNLSFSSDLEIVIWQISNSCISLAGVTGDTERRRAFDISEALPKSVMNHGTVGWPFKITMSFADRRIGHASNDES